MQLACRPRGRVAYTPVRSCGRGACRLCGLWHLRRFAVVNVPQTCSFTAEFTTTYKKRRVINALLACEAGY